MINRNDTIIINLTANKLLELTARDVRLQQIATLWVERVFCQCLLSLAAAQHSLQTFQGEQ
jgi:hypothetical protein